MFNTDIYLWTDTDDEITFSQLSLGRSDGIQLSTDETKQIGFPFTVSSGIQFSNPPMGFESNRDAYTTVGFQLGYSGGSSSEFVSWLLETFELVDTTEIGLDVYVEYTTNEIIFGWKSSVPIDLEFAEQLNFGVEQFLNKAWGLPLVKSDNQFDGRFIVDIDNRFEIILNPDNEYDIRALLDEDAIKQAIRNIFLIKQGEVPMYPYVGTAIYQWLFDKVDDTRASLMKLEIENEIRDNEPAIFPEKIEVIPEPDYRRYHIRIEWRLDEVNLKGSYTFTLRS